jgi:MFS family permease
MSELRDDGRAETRVTGPSRLVPLIVASAFFMDNFDAAAVATALPAIADAFDVSAVQAANGLTVYYVTLAAFIPISGWVADRFTVKVVLPAAIGLFTLAAVACALSTSIEAFIAARAVQGLAGSMMVPVGRLAVLRSVDRSEFVRTMSWVTVPALVSVAVGPPVAGFLATYVSWRWVFLVHVPVGILGVVLMLMRFPAGEVAKRVPFDTFGFVTTGGAVGLLMLTLEGVGRPDRPAAVTLGLLAAGLLLSLVAIRHATRQETPLLDVRLMRIQTFSRSVTAGNLFVTAGAAVPFLMPLLLQLGFGMSAFASGLLTFLAGVGALAMKAAAPVVIRRFGFRAVLAGNGLIAASTVGLMGLCTEATPALVIALLLLTFGFSRSLQFVALNTVAYANVPKERTSAATSFAGMTRQLANGAGVAGSAALVTLLAGGAEPSAAALATALMATGGLVVVSSVLFLGLDARAGEEMSGHRRPAQRQAGGGPA